MRKRQTISEKEQGRTTIRRGKTKRKNSENRKKKKKKLKQHEKNGESVKRTNDKEK